jgi:prephenate dehydrogenase
MNVPYKTTKILKRIEFQCCRSFSTLRAKTCLSHFHSSQLISQEESYEEENQSMSYRSSIFRVVTSCTFSEFVKSNRGLRNDVIESMIR